MTDQELDFVGAAFADVHLDGDARAPIARGRALRRRRRAVPIVATAAILAASLSLAVVARPSPGTSASGSKVAIVNVDEAGFSIHTDAKTGAVTVTFKQLFDEKLMASLLAKAGVRAELFNHLMQSVPGAQSCKEFLNIIVPDRDVLQTPEESGQTALTIYPAKMPAYETLMIGYTPDGPKYVNVDWFVATTKPVPGSLRACLTFSPQVYASTSAR